MDPIKKSPKIAKKYICEKCDYKCSKLSEFNRHLATNKHKNLQNPTYVGKSTYKCECGKIYKHSSTLYAHKKKCNIIETTNKVNELLDNQDIHQLINYLLKENADFKQMLLNQTTNISNNIYSNNNISNNKHFNLNVFLNETCKDAMNISDFVSSIKVNLEDLEHTGEKGYVEGISNIFIKNLNNIEQHLRPLHCSDSKREVFYIKNNNEWVKEKDDKPILTNAIKTIAHENVKQIKQWKEKYPDCTKSSSSKNDTYLQIVINSMNGSTNEESLSNIHKIISNISKKVVIDKSNYLSLFHL